MAVAHDHSAAERPVDVSPGGQTHQRCPVGDTSHAMHDLLDVHALSLPENGGRCPSSSTGAWDDVPAGVAPRRTASHRRAGTSKYAVSRSGGVRPIAPMSSAFERT